MSNEKYAKALDNLINARYEIVRLRADLARANERLAEVSAMLGDFMALPIRGQDHIAVRARVREFLEVDHEAFAQNRAVAMLESLKPEGG